MGCAWLYVHDGTMTWVEFAERLATDLQADPVAAAITDQEAEEFMTTSRALLNIVDKGFLILSRTMGITIKRFSPKERQRATLRMLRRWRTPRFRELLLKNAMTLEWHGLPTPYSDPEFWTEERYIQAIGYSLYNLPWVAQIRRLLHPEQDVREWLRSLDPLLEERYQSILDQGRLTLRRHVYVQRAQPNEAFSEAAPALLAGELKEKDRETGRLRQDLRRLEQERKRLREEARRRERAEKTQLSQARGEVAAARRALQEQRVACTRELAELDRRGEAGVVRLKRRLAAIRAEFRQELERLRGQFLAGQTVGVTAEDAELARLLVETLGGTWAPPPTEAGAVMGLADLERRLHGLALNGAVIRCDGSRRRVGRRPPIATSAFQVYVAGQPVHRWYRAICCGPLASSLMAEYGALLMALRWLAAAEPPAGTEVEIWSDCKYLLQHLEGRRPDLELRGCVTLDRRVRSLLRQLDRAGCRVRLKWVKRDLVDAEDRLCDLAYRGVVGRLPLSTFLETL